MNGKGARGVVLCLVFLLAGLPGICAGQEAVDLDSFVITLEEVGEVDRRTPLETAQGSLRFAQRGDDETAARYPDLRYLPQDVAAIDGALLAEQLYIMISRGMQHELGRLPARVSTASGSTSASTITPSTVTSTGATTAASCS